MSDKLESKSEAIARACAATGIGPKALRNYLDSVRSPYDDGVRFKMEYLNRWVTQEDVDKEFLAYAEEHGVYPALSKYARRDGAERERMMELWAGYAGVPNLTDEWIKADIKAQEKKPR